MAPPHDGVKMSLIFWSISPEIRAFGKRHYLQVNRLSRPAVA